VTIRFTLSIWRYLLVFWLVAGMASANATQNSVTLSGLPGVQVNASVITTDSSSAGVPTPDQPGWQPLRQPLSQGFGDRVSWVRIVIDVPQHLLNLPMVLRFQPPNARDVKFFLPDGSAVGLGTEARFDQRRLGFPDLAASFVPTSSPVVVGVRLATAGRQFGSFELMSEQTYYQSQAWRTALHGIFYGVLLLALLVNLLNWLTTRQSIYGLYVGFVVFSLFASLAVNSYLHAMFLGAWPQYHSVVQLLAFSGMAAAAIAFATRMLHLRAWSVRFEKGADLLAVMLLVLVLPAAIWGDVLPYVWEFVLAAFMVYGMGSLAASVRNLLQSQSLHNSLLATAFLIFVASQWVSMGVVFGLLPATPVNVGMWQIGLVVHLVFLQMALVINARHSRWREWQQQARLDNHNMQADTESRRSRDLRLFLERLTHEFKTPLAVIDSSVQSLDMLEQNVDSQRAVRYDRIRRAVARLNDLMMRSVVAQESALNSTQGTRQLLQLSILLEATLAEFASTEFNCSRDCSVKLDQDAQSGRMGQRHLRLLWKGIEHPESFWIEADVGRLHTAFYHLFDNALKYSLGDDEITVEIEKTERSDNTPGFVVSIVNRADGLLCEADLPRLFDKYYRKGEQSNVPGAGIGLFIARQAIEEHEGTLTARLINAVYIQFRIELPLVIRDSHPR